jgi:hypothetical protein
MKVSELQGRIGLGGQVHHEALEMPGIQRHHHGARWANHWQKAGSSKDGVGWEPNRCMPAPTVAT